LLIVSLDTMCTPAMKTVFEGHEKKATNPVLLLIDFLEEIAVGQKEKARANTAILCTYALYTFGAVAVWASPLCDRDFSAVLTMGSGIQSLGFMLLLQKIVATGSVAGISSKTLEMFAVMYVCRLTATLFRNGYLPIDASGDHVYQVTDMVSFFLVLQLLFCVRVRFAETYQKSHDSLPIWCAVPACVLLGACVHGHLDASFFFDSAWASSMYLDTLVMMPQLWMLVVQGGEVEALTSHYIAAYPARAACSLAFWWFGYPELRPEDGGMNIAGHLCLACHFVMLAVSCDFLYHYGHYMCHGRPHSKLVVPAMHEINI
jgi:hypothetical protein